MGYKIDRATVFKALNGDHAKNPRDETLQALAYVFEIDVRELRQLVGRPAGERDPWVPPEESAQLNDEQRRAIDQLIKAIVRRDVNVEGPVAEIKVEAPEPTVLGVLHAREQEQQRLRPVAHEGDAADADKVEELAKEARRRQTKGDDG